ncbi:MAG: hypothetical protein ABJN65_12280 [Parasphingorhabdus sp.]
MIDKKQTEELNEAELDNVQGGVGLLLPAVQSAREAARGSRSKTSKEFLSSGHSTGFKKTN